MLRSYTPSALTHFTTQLQRALMEGNYASINKSIKQLESQEHYKMFLDLLLQTMRRRIADALAKSSHEVS